MSLLRRGGLHIGLLFTTCVTVSTTVGRVTTRDTEIADAIRADIGDAIRIADADITAC